LGLVNARTEVLFQHFSISSKLEKINDQMFHSIFNCNDELLNCKLTLGLDGDTAKDLRIAYRESEFEKWSKMNYAGVGAMNCKIYTKANRFVRGVGDLSGGEWVAALKLTFNYANLYGVPCVAGNTGIGSTSHHCRRKIRF
jgi:hypothetical protein